VPFAPEVRELGWTSSQPGDRDEARLVVRNGAAVSRTFPGDGRAPLARGRGAARAATRDEGRPARPRRRSRSSRRATATIWASAGIETPGASTLNYLPPGANRFVNVPARRRPIPNGFALDFAEDAMGGSGSPFTGRLGPAPAGTVRAGSGPRGPSACSPTAARRRHRAPLGAGDGRRRAPRRSGGGKARLDAPGTGPGARQRRRRLRDDGRARPPGDRHPRAAVGRSLIRRAACSATSGATTASRQPGPATA